MLSESEFDALSGEIIGAAIAVHSKFGPGCFESAYMPCLAYELARRDLRFETAVWIDVLYDDVVVSQRAYQIDMIVEESILIELKATEAIVAVHTRQVLTYLK